MSRRSIVLVVALAVAPVLAQEQPSTPPGVGMEWRQCAIPPPTPPPPIAVPAGANLQIAIDAAQPGQTLELAAGATFVGNFVLPARLAAGPPVTIQSSSALALIPGRRVEAADEARMPVLRSPNALPALRTALGASGYRLIGIAFVAGSTGDIVQLGDGLHTDPALTPSDLVLDRVIIRAEPTSKNGLQLNSASTILANSRITGVKLAGQETHAVVGWNGRGPFRLENNYIEAGSIGVLFGGAEPAIDQLIPSDIVIVHNRITRPLEMRSGSWAVKNLLELKNARRVLIRGNLFERNWAQAQNGFSILFTVRAQGTRATWSTLEDVWFEANTVRDVAAGVNILGRDDLNASGVLHGLTIRGNLFLGVDGPAWGGNGAWVQIGGGPVGVTLERNTVLHTGNVMTLSGPPAADVRIVGNVARHNTYGIIGTNVGTGNAAIAAYLPGAVVSGNVLAGGNPNLYPMGNAFPATAALLADFTDPTLGDYSLRSIVGGVDVAELWSAARP